MRKKDPKIMEHIKALYDYLVDHQASLCLTSRWKAAWKKHSSVEAEENQKKEEIKQQKKQIKCFW